MTAYFPERGLPGQISSHCLHTKSARLIVQKWPVIIPPVQSRNDGALALSKDSKYTVSCRGIAGFPGGERSLRIHSSRRSNPGHPSRLWQSLAVLSSIFGVAFSFLSALSCSSCVVLPATPSSFALLYLLCAFLWPRCNPARKNLACFVTIGKLQM